MSSIFGIIILNYLGWEETVNCTQAFLKYSTGHKLHIVIVDNGSPNDSFEKLRNRYLDNDLVEVISTEKNLGFARGNNYGYLYLSQKHKCDYYIFSNSDVLINSDMCQWIEKEYSISHFTLLGPDIYAVKMHLHQNPLKTFTEKSILILAKLLKKRIEIIVAKILFGLNIEHDFFKKEFRDKPINKKDTFENVTLHGAFIIAHRDYFNHYDDFFDDRTFLYMEEHFLYLRCKSKQLKTRVSYGFQVVHLQAAATDRVAKSVYQRRITRLTNEIESLRVYKTALKDYKAKGIR